MDEQEYLPLSWLSQAEFCLRRAALLLNERVWEENADTAKGRIEHQKVHTQRVEHRRDRLNLYEYTVFSDSMGLVGKCDCIEAVRTENGCIIPAAQFPVSLYPVEYKHGSVREEPSYLVQLCAQAMCLEEMFHTTVSKGALFFITAHRRLEVALTEELRSDVQRIAQALRSIRDTFTIPAADYGPKCKRCSMKEYCMPKLKTSAQKYCEALSTAAEKISEAAATLGTVRTSTLCAVLRALQPPSISHNLIACFLIPAAFGLKSGAAVRREMKSMPSCLSFTPYSHMKSNLLWSQSG